MEDEIVPQSFVDIASSIKRLKMFPYFEVAHYILTCLLVRDDTYSSKIAGIFIYRLDKTLTYNLTKNVKCTRRSQRFPQKSSTGMLCWMYDALLC